MVDPFSSDDVQPIDLPSADLPVTAPIDLAEIARLLA